MTNKAITPPQSSNSDPFSDSIVFTGDIFSAAGGWTEQVSRKGEKSHLKRAGDAYIMVREDDFSKMEARFNVRGLWGNGHQTRVTIIDQTPLGMLEDGDRIEILTDFGPLGFAVEGDQMLQVSGAIALGNPNFDNPLALIKEAYLLTLDRTLDILCN